MDTENTRIFLPENWSRDAVCIDPEVRPDYGFRTSGLGPGSYWQFQFRKKHVNLTFYIGFAYALIREVSFKFC